jgi:hypothetical protein
VSFSGKMVILFWVSSTQIKKNQLFIQCKDEIITVSNCSVVFRIRCFPDSNPLYVFAKLDPSSFSALYTIEFILRSLAVKLKTWHRKKYAHMIIHRISMYVSLSSTFPYFLSLSQIWQGKILNINLVKFGKTFVGYMFRLISCAVSAYITEKDVPHCLYDVKIYLPNFNFHFLYNCS